MSSHLHIKMLVFLWQNVHDGRKDKENEHGRARTNGADTIQDLMVVVVCRELVVPQLAFIFVDLSVAVEPEAHSRVQDWEVLAIFEKHFVYLVVHMRRSPVDVGQRVPYLDVVDSDCQQG